ELLEQINRLRTDPGGELDRIFSDKKTLQAWNDLINLAISGPSYPQYYQDQFLNEWKKLANEAVAPLAFDASLNGAALSHTQKMVSAEILTHQTSTEPSLENRVLNAGFIPGLLTDDGKPVVAENICGNVEANGSYSEASYILAAFAVDWGNADAVHRASLMNASFTEVGISMLDTRKSIGTTVATVDLGCSNLGACTDGAWLLGVIYNDLDSDSFYDVGEGMGNVPITIQRLNSSGSGVSSVQINSMQAGGYQIFLANGSYQVTVSGGANNEFGSGVTKTVVIRGGVNAKLDFLTGDYGTKAPVLDLNGDAAGIDAQAIFAEGADSAVSVVSSDLTITDEDSDKLYGAKIFLENRPDGLNEMLDVLIEYSGFRVSYNQQGRFITINGQGTITEYTDILKSLTYFNESDVCDLTDRTILVSVYDGVYWSQEARITLSVEPTVFPTLTVQDTAVYEGDVGTGVASFVATLDAPARQDVTFKYRATNGGTAFEELDYIIGLAEPVTIRQGETEAVFEVYIVGNYQQENLSDTETQHYPYELPYKDFQLEIYCVENAVLGNVNGTVTGTIYEDDVPIALGTVTEWTQSDT
ncbi:MAG: hypothetical protein IKW74_00710, partial [Thermoguttaceae bacterium]|nr:hypothetical protein [Thermoguttaceae bacterium]